MKNLLLITLIITSNILVFAQTVTLDLSNPIQRIGDNLSVNYEINPNAFKINTITNEKPTPRTCKTPDFSIGKGIFHLTKEFDITGIYTIGPFKFNIEGNSYESNTLTLNIFPELPNTTTGLWVNFVNSNEKHFVVIEHRVEGRHNSRPDPLNANKKDSTFAVLKDSIFNVDIIDIIGKKSTSRISKINGKWCTQKNTIYELWLNNNYKNSFYIEEKHMKNIPDGINLQPILIAK